LVLGKVGVDEVEGDWVYGLRLLMGLGLGAVGRGENLVDNDELVKQHLRGVGPDYGLVNRLPTSNFTHIIEGVGAATEVKVVR
jgi:hypothetical protein